MNRQYGVIIGCFICSIALAGHAGLANETGLANNTGSTNHTGLTNHAGLTNKEAANNKPHSEKTLQQNSDSSLFVRKPVWEFGVGGAGFSGFDYPASNDPNKVSLVLPYFIYRSQVVRLADGGVGAVAFEKPRVKLDVSLGGSLNAESSGNAAREGMPDLDFLFEVGPRLNALLFNREYASGGRSTVRWLNSVRGVISTDFGSVDTRGFLFNSELEWKRRNIFGSVFDLQLQLDAQWASQALQAYFYSVDEAFVDAERPAYRAKGGYLSTGVSAGITYRVTPAIRIFTAVKHENYNNAANKLSPLFETDSSVSYAIALVWTIKQSKETLLVFDND